MDDMALYGPCPVCGTALTTVRSDTDDGGVMLSLACPGQDSHPGSLTLDVT